MVDPRPSSLQPPPYTIPSQDGAGASTSPNQHQQYPVPANVNPSNFVRISRPGSIEGTWIIDPSIIRPSDLLPPLVTGETHRSRKNIRLDSEGNIDSEIFVMPGYINQDLLMANRVSIWASSDHGDWVSVKVHDLFPDEFSQDAQTRPALHISAEAGATDARLYIYLPRSFCGPLRIKTPGRVHYSKLINASLTPISEVDNNYQTFVGNFDALSCGENMLWMGDELKATCKGPVNIYFDDEDDVMTIISNGCTTS